MGPAILITPILPCTSSRYGVSSSPPSFTSPAFISAPRASISRHTCRDASVPAHPPSIILCFAISLLLLAFYLPPGFVLCQPQLKLVNPLRQRRNLRCLCLNQVVLSCQCIRECLILLECLSELLFPLLKFLIQALRHAFVSVQRLLEMRHPNLHPRVFLDNCITLVVGLIQRLAVNL